MQAKSCCCAWRPPSRSPARRAPNWDIGLLVSLLVLSIAGDFLALAVHGRINISGSFLALVLAMVFLGGAPAALVGVVTIVVGRLHWKEPPQAFLNNLVTYASFPLAVGLGYHALARSAGLTTSDSWFYAAVLGVFAVSLILNFALIAAYNCALDGSSFRSKVTDVLVPVLPTEVVAAVLAIVVTYLYVHLGLKAIALFGLVIFYVQYLLGKLLLAEEHAAELEHRTSQLASFQLGLITALLHTLDLRDRMTARHSAAVSRYSREIARAAGYPEQAQELVHTAALLHDIGKFAFPDHILKGETPLTEEDWDIIRAHPAEGARIVSKVEGYGPVGELILAHHERIDGLGYPGGLRGDRDPRPRTHHRRGRHLRRDDRPRLLPHAALVGGGDRRAAPGCRHAARRSLRGAPGSGARGQEPQLQAWRGRGLRRGARARAQAPRVRHASISHDFEFAPLSGQSLKGKP